jgi:hypothetical protein
VELIISVINPKINSIKLDYMLQLLSNNLQQSLYTCSINLYSVLYNYLDIMRAISELCSGSYNAMMS